tara:strand:+ start:457 stop:831 length:375 start_codon:yes stop_codon:yes gene_type:complete
MAFLSELKAGDFNTRIKLKSISSNQDVFGGFTPVFTDHATVWANLNIKTLRNIEEKFEGDELQSYGRFVFTIRYSSETKTIKSNWIIEDVETTDIYEITGFAIDPRKEYIQLFVKQDLPTTSPI